MIRIIPRDYQIAAAESVPEYFSKHDGHPIIAMPTGTGKSIVIAMVIQWIHSRNCHARIACVTHVKKLISQNHETLMKMWPNAPVGIYSAGLNRRDTNTVTFAGIASIGRKPEVLGWQDIVIIDECHLLSPKEKTMYRKVIAFLMKQNPALKVIGLTATPYRMGQGPLTEEDGLFTDVCIDMTDMVSFNWFIDQGYIVPLVPKKTELILNLDNIHKIGGDFNQKELEAAVDKEAITEAALRETMELAFDRQCWLVFASGVSHAIHIQQMLEWLGVSCSIVHSKQTDEINEAQYKSWESGDTRAIVNYGVLTTGVDNPKIDCIVMLRATDSTSLWVQMLGRGTRPVYASGFDLTTRDGRLSAIAASDKRTCLALDFGRNSKRLGPINDPVLPHKKGKGKGQPPVKECPVCGVISHISVRHCGGFPYKTEYGCGYQFPIAVKINEQASTDEILRRPEEAPIIETFGIDRVEYHKHQKKNGSPSLKVVYWKLFQAFTEWVNFEQPEGTRPRLYAEEWWRKRHPQGRVPFTVEEAYQQVNSLAKPTHMRVVVNRKWPEIKAFCFDGTAFGMQPSDHFQQGD